MPSGWSHILRTRQEVDGTEFEPKVTTWSLLQEVRGPVSSKVRISWGSQKGQGVQHPLPTTVAGTLKPGCSPLFVETQPTLQPAGQAAAEEKPPTAPTEALHSQ